MNKDILLTIKENIDKHHQLYPNIPIKDVYWESILSNSLSVNHYLHSWKFGSHSIDTDISTLSFGNISCKSGKLKNKDTVITVSGSRTTTHKSLEEKINFLSIKNSDYIYCLSYNNNQYNLFEFNTNIFDYQDKVWCETESGWNTIDRDSKLKTKIVKACSDQIWYDIPVILAERTFGFPVI